MSLNANNSSPSESAQSTDGGARLAPRPHQHTRHLSPTEELDYARLARQGDTRAREKLIACNVALVVSLARKYTGCGVDLDDLVQDGYVGLMKAIDRFDPAKEARLASYAAPWIRGAILRAIQKHGRTVKLSERVLRDICAYKRAVEQLTREGVALTLGNIAAALNVSVDRVARLQALCQATLSLDAPPETYEPEDSAEPATLLDAIEDDTRLPPDDAAASKQQIARLTANVDKLTPRQRDVIERRFGLNGHEPQTLDQVGEHLGVSTTRVRTIQTRAMRTLRSALTDPLGLI